ncbi:ABC transporter substrate-binding protein [Ectopseudomonas alcaliphila]|uniref:ABC transporter substrate-binding protein n=1 Tax=Ectopseudomonas alcaliphila TaxID=101564 RepID=UPI0027D8D670|nr:MULTISPECIES: ABC transporter substrate-binding protein [Pseudomonas]
MCCALASAQSRAPSVVFLNPGYSNEHFWTDYTRYMQDAAGDLGIELKVLYGERDPVRMLSNARQVVEGEHPDYLIFTNEQFLGPVILRLFQSSKVRLFALHSTLTAEQQALIGGSRERHSNWLGSLVPNDEEAGYLMGRDLIALSKGQPAELLAFSGVKQTPSSMLRLAGLQRALNEAPHIRLVQSVHGEWQEQRAYEQALGLLPRYPGVSLVWSANDAMAFGVMRAAGEQGRVLRYAALNNSERVLQAHIDGRIEVLSSGHFLLGACALVMLNDHAHGLDFIERGGKDQVASLLRMVDRAQSQKLLERLGQSDIDMDFRQVSALTNPQQQRYDCSIASLLD